MIQAIADSALALASIWLGSLFVYSGSIKLLAPGEAVRSVQGYKMLPSGAAWIVGRSLPYAEVVAGALLLLTPSARIGAYIGLVFGVVFTFASVSVLARGINTSCGCAGGSSDRVTLTTTARAVLIALAAGAVMIAGSPAPAPASWIVFGLALMPAIAMVIRRSLQRRSDALGIALLPRGQIIRPKSTSQ